MGGVGYVRGIVGGGAIAALVALALAPLVSLLLYRACFGIAGLFLGMCSKGEGERVLASFAFALDSLIAVYALTVTVYVLQLAVFMKGGASLA